MNKLVANEYRRLRAGGYGAASAIRAARIVCEFNSSENVELLIVPEDDSYFSVYGDPEGYVNEYGRRVSPEEERREIEERIARNGVWCAVAKYRCPTCGTWKTADSVGMLEGYSDPADPAVNWYVPDLMESALEALKTA